MRLPALIGASLCSAAFATSLVYGQVPNNNNLRAVSEFASIQDPTAHSRALFTKAAKVITSPRCMNCHPAGDHPLQGNDQHEHMPPAWRGESGGGVAGALCSSCHTEQNFTLVGTGATYKSIPGHQRWGLAPIEMAWEGKSIHQICEQIKDPKRNGGRELSLLHDHIAHDDLVGWAWHPGEGRDPAPGTQERAGELIQAWIDTGAQCP
jgi:hypothetical protein